MELVLLNNNQVTTTSILIAETFNKDHKDVLKAIQSISCSEDFSRRNFSLSDYEVRGKKYPIYVITKDGFSMLVMGFTGKKATKFKEDYINAFNTMEAMIKHSQIDPLKRYTERILSEPTKGVPLGYWSVFDHSHSVMLLVEKHIGTYSQFDLIDGSIGKRWANYRKTISFGKNDAMPFGSGREPKKYPHVFTDTRGVRDCTCYHNDELTTFLGWLKSVYQIEHLPDYLQTKYAENQAIIDRVKEVFPKMINKPKAA